jgi:colicin import membrane protein
VIIFKNEHTKLFLKINFSFFLFIFFTPSNFLFSAPESQKIPTGLATIQQQATAQQKQVQALLPQIKRLKQKNLALTKQQKLGRSLAKDAALVGGLKTKLSEQKELNAKLTTEISALKKQADDAKASAVAKARADKMLADKLEAAQSKLQTLQEKFDKSQSDLETARADTAAVKKKTEPTTATGHDARVEREQRELSEASADRRKFEAAKKGKKKVRAATQAIVATKRLEKSAAAAKKKKLTTPKKAATKPTAKVIKKPTTGGAAFVTEAHKLVKPAAKPKDAFAKKTVPKTTVPLTVTNINKALFGVVNTEEKRSVSVQDVFETSKDIQQAFRRLWTGRENTGTFKIVRKKQTCELQLLDVKGKIVKDKKTGKPKKETLSITIPAGKTAKLNVTYVDSEGDTQLKKIKVGVTFKLPDNDDPVIISGQAVKPISRTSTKSTTGAGKAQQRRGAVVTAPRTSRSKVSKGTNVPGA